MMTNNHHTPSRSFLVGVGLLGLFVALFAAIQFATPHLAGNDGYFHIKFAWVMGREGLRPPFPWLPLTILNPQDYFDHHFLFHVLLIPFTYGDLRLGAKWASVIFPALALLSGWLVLRGQGIPHAPLWALGFVAMSDAFLYRLSMPRVQSLSLLMMFLILHVTLTRRYRWLLPLLFLYTWLHDAFPIILAMLVIYVLIHGLLERRLVLSPLAYAVAGIGLGLVLNPYFPHNITFIYHHILPKLTQTTALRVGKEWYPYESWSLVKNSGPALVAFILGAFALGLPKQRLTTTTATLFWTAVLFGLMLFKSRRFVEYYPAFALLFCAAAWQPLLQQWPLRRRHLLPLGLALVLIPVIGYNLHQARQTMRGSKSHLYYAEAATWLAAKTPPGSPIFHTDWDDFTRLYYHNTHNTYIVGLDPTYMQQYDPDLYKLWQDITKGRVERPAKTILENFNTHYVLTDLKHTDFIHQARNDPLLEEVYRDEYATIYRVLE